ncbi:hypothetical protein BGZ73_007142 [Actinomortierella ambigua]|nr:hypothetical protein BGZ73_007142 [Actinomortierella ambigua]
MADYQSVPQNDHEEGGHAYPRPNDKFAFLRKKNNVVLAATAAIGILVVSAYLLGATNELSYHRVHQETVGISKAHFEEGVAKCKAIHNDKRHLYLSPEDRQINERFVNGTEPILFTNGYFLDGAGKTIEGDLLIDRGLIVQIGKDVKAPKHVKTIDLKGHIVTPGIVDMHSHLGVDSWPALAGTDDTNEMTQPMTPFVRSIDAFNPSDVARKWVVSGGVTSVLVLPGSGNIMGGEAYSFKLRKVDTLSNEDMLVEAGVKNRWRYMKMACGENPKRYYGTFDTTMPSTRLGEGWLVREQFSKAQKLKKAQDDWCDAALALPRFGRHRLLSPFPEDAQYESLVGVLRDDVRLNIHCYETHDIEAMVRHSNEYKFKITAFHHALDAYRVPEILRRAYKHVPTVATFAAKFGYKKEAFQSSTQAPKILADAGIAVALKSDHPVINSQHLINEAALAHHYGLSEDLALSAVTSVPATALGLDHRIGKLAVGMDADLVIWNKHPLELGAHPKQVYIDGIEQIENVNPEEWSKQKRPQPFQDYPDMQVPKVKHACTPEAKDGVFTGIKKIILESSDELVARQDEPLSVVVKDGKLVCVGSCSDEVRAAKNDEIPVYDLNGEGYVIPSLISGFTPLVGTAEIAQEEVTSDGEASDSTPILLAADALKFGGMHLDEAYKAGVLSAITSPSANGVVQGVSVAFSTGAKDALSSKQAVLREKVALHVRLGQESKTKSLFPTISSQIGFLRHNLRNPTVPEFKQVANGELPLIVEVENRDEIVRVIQLKKELAKEDIFIKVTLLGATEAWTVADHLVDASIGVILRPYLCTPVMWQAQQCLPGAPLSKDTGLSVLLKAGVKVGLSAVEQEDVRQLPWVAGWALSDLGLTEKEALGLVSWNLAELVDLPTGANGLVLYTGSPFKYGAKVGAILGGGKAGIQCNPRAF